jgi:hypothetical protein
MRPCTNILQFEKRGAHASLPASTRLRIIPMNNPNPSLVSHVPHPPVFEVTDGDFRTTMDFFVHITSVLRRAADSHGWQLAPEIVVEAYLYHIRTWPAERREIVKRVLSAAIQDVIGYRLRPNEQPRATPIPTARAIRRNGAVIVLCCPHCRREHRHGPASETGGHKAGHCLSSPSRWYGDNPGYFLEIEEEAS